MADVLGRWTRGCPSVRGLNSRCHGLQRRNATRRPVVGSLSGTAARLVGPLLKPCGAAAQTAARTVLGLVLGPPYSGLE